MTLTDAATGHWYGLVLVVCDRSFAVRRGRAAKLAAVVRSPAEVGGRGAAELKVGLMVDSVNRTRAC